MRFLYPVIFFLLAVAGFAWLAKAWYQGAIENELESIAESTLSEAGLEGVQVSFDHHDVLLAGFVDSPEQRGEVVSKIQAALPMARIDAEAARELPIRPSLPAELVLTRAPSARKVLLEGVFGADGEALETLIQRRLLALPGVDEVICEVELDPRRLSLRSSAELASIAAELFRASDEARLSFEEGRLEIRGQVENAGLRDGILDLAARVDADSVDSRISVAEPTREQPVSEFTLTRNRFGVVLSGRVGSVEAVKRLVSDAIGGASTARVTERLEVDGGVKASAWESASSRLFPRLLDQFVGEMTAEFRGDQVRLTGIAESQGSIDSLVSELRKIGGKDVEVVTEVALRETPRDDPSEGETISRLLVTFQPDQLTLTGNLPDISFLDDLGAALAERAPDYVIENELAETPSAADPGWVEGLPEFLAEFIPRMEEGNVSFDETALRMEGITREVTDPRILENVAINTVPLDFSIVNKLSHEREPEPLPGLTGEQREKLAAELEKLPIYFAQNSEVVAPDEQEKVDSIHALVENLGVPIELVATGFADNVGNAEYNRQLSLRRAESVVAALVALGIPRESIEKVSRGEDVTNVARSERWKARRVEISLAPPEEAGESEQPDADPS